jgi:hypothetical protein
LAVPKSMAISCVKKSNNPICSSLVCLFKDTLFFGIGQCRK